jgi:hypothetical protein
MSCVHYSPPFATLATAVERLPVYGISPKLVILPANPTYASLLSQAPIFPLELYALAASFDLYDLAVATSSHLLSFPLATLSDEMAERIGPVYLKRLFFLHFGRSDALKRVLLPPPHPHAPTAWCDFNEQKKLTRAWALASAYLAWDARPGMSFNSLVQTQLNSANRSVHKYDGISITTPSRASDLRPVSVGTEGKDQKPSSSVVGCKGEVFHSIYSWF